MAPRVRRLISGRRRIATLGVLGLIVVLTLIVLGVIRSRPPDTLYPPVAAPSSPSVRAYPDATSPTGATRVVTPESFGAVGNGSTDDTVALQKALDSLRPTDVLAFGQGKIYRHSAVLYIKVPGSHLSGPGIILATDEEKSAVWIDADNVTLDGGLVLQMGATTQRWEAPEQHKLTLNGHTGAIVANVTINGSAGAGVYVDGASHYLLKDLSINNTRADGIHNTGQAHDGLIVRPVIRNPGDDGVGVVSYRSDGGVCHDILIDSPSFYGSSHGRAFSVVGGANITYRNVFATGSAAAGVYIAAEKSYDTFGATHIQVLGGDIENANQDATVNHGAVLVTTDGTSQVNSDIRIEDLKIVGTRETAARQVGVLADGTGENLRVQLLRFTIVGGPDDVLETDSAPDEIATVGWTVNGAARADHQGFPLN